MAKAIKKQTKRVAKKNKQKKARRKSASRSFSLFRFIRKLFLWAIGFCALGILAAFLWVLPTLPSLDKAFNHSRDAMVTVLDANGKVIYRQNTGWGEALHVDDIPKTMSDALIAVEDKRFYYHFGIDPYALSRAIYHNLRNKSRQGGSTLTQQLAKNVFLTHERTLKRKAQEAFLSLWLEWKFTKAQILTIYLNRVYYGTNAWGIDGASQTYFGHSAKELSLWESAMLAGIMRSPNNYNPHSNKERAERRTKLVLKLMLDQNRITKDQYDEALKEGSNKQYPKITLSRSYYIDWILEQSKGFIQTSGNDLIIHSTLDSDLQQKAEQLVAETLQTSGKSSKVSQAALLSITTDGAVIAMVGGVDYQQSQFNRAVQAKRQPGSSFKPLLWQIALQKGMLLSDIVEDKPININGWKPQNYNRKYQGKISLLRALETSSNTVAVQLGQHFGQRSLIDTAYKQGVETELRATPSIALGSSEVTMMDMISVYATWASSGRQVFPWGIKMITTSRGELLYQQDHLQYPNILSTPVVAQMNYALSNVIENGTGKNARLPFDVAGKTGTTQDYRDAWFIGYSSQFITAVWMGNDDNSPTKNLTGSDLPAKLWKSYMKVAHDAALPLTELLQPENLDLLDQKSPLRDLILW